MSHSNYVSKSGTSQTLPKIYMISAKTIKKKKKLGCIPKCYYKTHFITLFLYKQYSQNILKNSPLENPFCWFHLGEVSQYILPDSDTNKSAPIYKILN